MDPIVLQVGSSDGDNRLRHDDPVGWIMGKGAVLSSAPVPVGIRSAPDCPGQSAVVGRIDMHGSLRLRST